MVMCTGQGHSWQKRHESGMRQVALLKRSCTLTLQHVEQIKACFLSGPAAACSESADISFARFRRLLHAVGIGEYPR